MSCKRSEQCDHANICQFAQSDDYHLLGGSCYRPKKPQTNEEWFYGLSTEEKADLLFGTFYLAGRNDEKRGVWKGVDTIMEWLKQPHTNE